MSRTIRSMLLLSAACGALLLAPPASAAAQGPCMTCKFDANFGLYFCALHGDPEVWGNCAGPGELCGEACLQSATDMSIGHFAALDMSSEIDVAETIQKGFTNVEFDLVEGTLTLLNCGGQPLVTRRMSQDVAERVIGVGAL